jgi:hypothetical protein
MANGASQDINPRVAPQGTIARVQDYRIDQRGRLVPRRGYTSLGSVVGGFVDATLVPFDLLTLDNELFCLGNNAPGVQTGIRAIYRYADDIQGDWRLEYGNRGSADQGSLFMMLPAADKLEQLVSDPSQVDTDSAVASVAITADGRFTCMVSTDTGFFGPMSRWTIIDNTTDQVVHYSDTGTITDGNAQVIAIGNEFIIFTQNTAATTIQARALAPGIASFPTSVAATVASGAGAFPARYDVANYEGTNDLLIAFATAGGYEWRRYNHASIGVFTLIATGTTADATLSGQALSICGFTGENVHVLACRNTTQVVLRSFNPATGASVVGPTVTGTADLYSWCSIVRMNSAQLHIRFMGETALGVANRTVITRLMTQAGHVETSLQAYQGTRPWVRPFRVDSEYFSIETLGQDAPAPYGIVHVSSNTVSGTQAGSLHGILFDGIAKVTYSSGTSAYVSTVAIRPGTKQCYAALVTKDPRDNTFRVSLVRFEMWSGRRRQAVAVAGVLYISGGVIATFDRRLICQAGFEIAPTLRGVTQAGGGAMTLLGVYQFQAVWRYVMPNGEVIQSAPSPPLFVTLTGGNNRVTFRSTKPYTVGFNGFPAIASVQAYLDIYRTEAGGSIPRLVQSAPCTFLLGGTYGEPLSVTTGEADSVAQAGAPMYTQGADGSVSGRLPLGLASPAELIAESDGKVLLARQQELNDLQLSIEKRPGEAVSFVNDDLFFVSNPEPITGIVSAEDGRRFIFAKERIRELVGQGPNAAGVGDISNPVEIESRVGCGDWRSICKTEHGIFFRTGSTDRPGIYLLPRGGSQAVEVSEGIAYLLEEFPVVTSATRHEEEQLLTFTLQNAAGTDGRIAHLDLKMSGQDPKRGWVGAWLVDRVALFEGVPDIEIVSQERIVHPTVAANPTIVTIQMPKGRRLGDRIVLVMASGGPFATSSVSGFTFRSAIFTTSGYITIYERLLTTQAAAQTTAVNVFANGTASGSVVSFMTEVFLLRNTHPSQALELVSVLSNVSITSYALPTLTPTWGSAKNLWLTVANADSTFFNNATANAGPARPMFAVPPTDFELLRFDGTSANGSNTFQSMSSASRVLEAAALSGQTWGINASSGSGAAGVAFMMAIRPLPPVANASPVRASVQWRDRLVVCNSASVFIAGRDAFDDDGVGITPEWESCDIYPMGVGGDGRHLSVLLLCEVLGYCDVTCWYSYDNGDTWVRGVTYQITPTFGYGIGQTIRLLWVPYRRKIQGVRVKFTVQDSVNVPQGTTRGLALYQAVLMFEDLAGQSRLPAAQRGNTGVL